MDSSTLLSTDYQLEKFVKHHVLDPSQWVVSIFGDPAIGAYQNWVVNSVSSGCVTFDSRGYSYIFVAGREVGLTYKQGSFYTVGDAVKVVYPGDPGRVHAYPLSSHVVAAQSCARCGGPVVA